MDQAILLTHDNLDAIEAVRGLRPAVVGQKQYFVASTEARKQDLILNEEDFKRNFICDDDQIQHTFVEVLEVSLEEQ